MKCKLCRYVLWVILIFFSMRANSQRDIAQPALIDSIQISNFCNTNNISADACERTLKFYQQRKFDLSWFRDGELIPQASLLVNTIEN